MEQVYLIMKRTSEDYHGCWDEVVQVVAEITSAESIVKILSDNNHSADVEYFVDVWPIT